jgi:hypothetical protein
MTESVFENSTLTGNNVKAGQTAYQKYFDSITNKWERVTGSSGAPVTYVVGSDDGLVLESSSWTGSVLLKANESITGSWFNASDYASTCILIRTDKTGTLYFDHSMDSVSIDRTMMFTINSSMINTGSFYVGSPRATFIRMRYTNDATPQTIFRLQTILYKTDKSGIAFPLGTTLVDTTTIQPVKAVISGKTTVGGGTYVDVKVSPAGAVQVGGDLDNVTNVSGVRLTGSTVTLAVTGSAAITGSVYLTDSTGSALRLADSKLRVSSMPYLYDIVEGNITGHSGFTKLGNVSTVINAEQDIWNTGGKYVFPTTTGSMILQSSSPLDHSTGSGIRTLTITYLDQNYVSKTEVMTLNGVTPVPTTATDIYRVNSIRPITVGTLLKAAGTINLTGSTNSNIYRSLVAGQTRGRSLIYTVPSGSTLYIDEVHISSAAIAAGHFSTFTMRANFNDTTLTKISYFQPWFEITLQDEANDFDFKAPVRIPTTCDVVGSVIADASNANTVCYGSWRGWLET